MDKAFILSVTADLKGEILHAHEEGGTVCVVSQHNGERRYTAVEFTDNGEGGHDEAGGYSTTDKYHYMGQRYQGRERWGIFYSEVFWVEGESVKAND